MPAPYLERRPHLLPNALRLLEGFALYGNTSPLYFRSIFIICDAHTTKLFGSTHFKMRTPYLSGGHFGSRRTLGRSRALAGPRTCYSICEVIYVHVMFFLLCFLFLVSVALQTAMS